MTIKTLQCSHKQNVSTRHHWSLTKISHAQCGTSMTRISHCIYGKMISCSHTELATHNLACSQLCSRQSTSTHMPLWYVPKTSSSHACFTKNQYNEGVKMHLQTSLTLARSELSKVKLAKRNKKENKKGKKRKKFKFFSLIFHTSPIAFRQREQKIRFRPINLHLCLVDRKRA